MAGPFEFVTDDELREMFNSGQYFERMLAGEFRAEVVSQNAPRRSNNQPRGTRSQLVDYYDHDYVRVARVHQYRLPDGSIGGSGRPDPKLLLHEGMLYILDDEDHWDN